MNEHPIDVCFWILVGFVGGFVTICLFLVALFAFLNWQCKAVFAARERRSPANRRSSDAMAS
ncbi:hypothetical protein QP179_10165 [Sphingomonas aurantiaca]|uniref:hypothetical protein n=1 Tax=Sphingomonas aurantiaca TaxID=185949 RepID=UPI002FE15A7E